MGLGRQRGPDTKTGIAIGNRKAVGRAKNENASINNLVWVGW